MVFGNGVQFLENIFGAKDIGLKQEEIITGMMVFGRELIEGITGLKVFGVINIKL